VGRWSKIGIAALVAVVAVSGALWAMKWFAPGALDRRPKLVDTPPLAPVSRNSMIVTPAVISLTAIRNALESAAPPELTGKVGMPQMAQIPIMPNAEINWSVTRTPLDIVGRPEGLQLSTALRGSLQATGLNLGQGGFQLPPGLGPPGGFRGPPGFPGPPGGFFGPPGGSSGGQSQSGAQGRSGAAQDQRVEFSGNVMLTARPSILPGWRIAPNLTAQASIGDASLSIMGMQLNLSNEMKPRVEQLVSEQVAALQSRMSNDPSVEQGAREGWARMCRSIPLGQGVPGAPKLWLELRPTRAMAAQPRIDNNAVTLTIGVQADTRIVPNETKPDCPFPAQLDLVQQLDRGRVKIEMPVDMPLTEVNRQIEAQLKGKVFPEDRRGAVTATIRSVNLAASGNRLLMSIGITANESKSWFGLSADGTVHVWGRPSLDRARQTLRLDEITVDIESEAALGALALAARAAVPALERMVAENSVIDLRPMTADIRRNVEAAISDSRNTVPGVQVDAAVVDIRLADVGFDAKTVRVIVEAEGTVSIAVTELPNR
jgi:hypothetical protein